MWQVIFFGTIGLFLVAIVYVQFFSKSTRQSDYDRTADETTNWQILDQQAQQHRDDFGGI